MTWQGFSRETRISNGIDRSQQAAKQLAEVGVKVGGYRLEPALGGKLVPSSGQSPVRKGQQG